MSAETTEQTPDVRGLDRAGYAAARSDALATASRRPARAPLLLNFDARTASPADYAAACNIITRR